MSYFFQLGFDFGDRYSTCIYRDLYNNENKSYIYSVTNDNNFLISNAIVYKDNIFYTKTDNTDYKNSLYNIRNAVISISQNNFSTESIYRTYAVSNKSLHNEELSNFINASCLFLLSRIFFKIRTSIIKQFNNFGKDPDDIILINMTLPLKYYEDYRVRNNFKFLLHKSWELASNKQMKSSASLNEMLKIIKSPYNYNDICHVCPYEIVSSSTIKNLIIKNSSKRNDIYIIISIFANIIKSYICRYTINNKLQTKIYSYHYYYEDENQINNNLILTFDNINTYINKRIKPILSGLKDLNPTVILLCDNYKDSLYKKFIKSSFSKIKNIQICSNILDENKVNENFIGSEIFKNLYYLHASYGASFIYEDLPEYIIKNIKCKNNPQITNSNSKINVKQQRNTNSNTKVQHKQKLVKKVNTSTVIYYNEPTNNVCPFCHGKNPNCLQCGGFGYTNSILTSCSSD